MNKGFTLIELLVVVLIIGILAAVALPQYQTAVERSRATEALTQMSAVAASMERFHAQHESWPTTFNQLDIDIPEIEAYGDCTQMSNKTYGGKNFCLSFTGGTATNGVITALRKRNNHFYTLTTTIVPNANGTYTATRSCTPQASDDEALASCNAITGSHNNNF